MFQVLVKAGYLKETISDLMESWDQFKADPDCSTWEIAEVADGYMQMLIIKIKDLQREKSEHGYE